MSTDDYKKMAQQSHKFPVFPYNSLSFCRVEPPTAELKKKFSKTVVESSFFNSTSFAPFPPWARRVCRAYLFLKCFV
jgi:hypothetical protein